MTIITLKHDPAADPPDYLWTPSPTPWPEAAVEALNALLRMHQSILITAREVCQERKHLTPVDATVISIVDAIRFQVHRVNGLIHQLRRANGGYWPDPAVRALLVAGYQVGGKDGCPDGYND